MFNKTIILFVSVIFIITARPLAAAEIDAPDFWAPAAPPHAFYTIDCRIDLAKGLISGTEKIEFENNAAVPLRRLALNWALAAGQNVDVTCAGIKLPALAEPGQKNIPSPMLFDLPQPLPPGGKLALLLNFEKQISARADQVQIILNGFHPRLWWGFETHDDFAVKVNSPFGYTLACSGRFDNKTGFYRADQVRSFGLFLGKGMGVFAGEIDGVLVRDLHTPAGRDCARLLFKTAQDIIHFYGQRFGFYPQGSLTILPGADTPMGGYPLATAMVVVHGQEKFSGKDTDWWRWITAHEIGHQYWLEHVLSATPGDTFSYLMIGLGLYADREYCRARGITGYSASSGWFANYANGLREHLDTTIELPAEQIAAQAFDRNNIVIHSKGFGVISSLAALLGKETFDRVYIRALKEFAGRCLGTEQFRKIAEEESGTSLGWFFEEWVRSNHYPAYDIISKQSHPQDGRYASEVTVKRLGTLKMPVSVEALFSDGSRQRQRTERLLDVQTLRFQSAAPLQEAKIDPDNEIPLVMPPPEMNAAELARAVEMLEYTGAGSPPAVELFHKAWELKSADKGIWPKLGLVLYDSGYYPESLAAFEKAAELNPDTAWLVAWQGHILDLAGRRSEALERYRKALAINKGFTRHDQYGIVLDRKWIEERLKTPFKR